MEQKGRKNNIARSSSEPITSPTSPTSKSLERLSVTQLKARLKAVNLPIYGCKRTLCQRLMMGSSPQRRSLNHAGSITSTFSQSTFPLFDSPQTGQSPHQRDGSVHSSIAEYKLVDLRQQCIDYNLPSSGRKQELVDRLELYHERQLLNDIPEVAHDDSHNAEHELFDHEWDYDAPQDPFFQDSRLMTDFSPENIRQSQLSYSSLEDPLVTSRGFPVPSKSNPILWAQSMGPRSSRPQKAPKSFDIDTISKEALEEYTLTQLRDICRSLALTVTGRKSELIDRVIQKKNGIAASNLMPPPVSKRLKKENSNAEVGVQSRSSQGDILRAAISGYSRTRSGSKSNVDDDAESKIKRTTRAAAIINQLKNDLTNERFYLIRDTFNEKERIWTCVVQEKNDTTEYTSCISECPYCNCEMFRKKEVTCKHILFILLRVLKLRVEDSVLTKPRLCSSELNMICEFIKSTALQRPNKMPVAAKPILSLQEPSHLNDAAHDSSLNQVRICGICCEPFALQEGVISCRPRCGKTVHQECFTKWTHANNPNELLCPYCSCTWPPVPKNTRYQSKLKRTRLEDPSV